MIRHDLSKAAGGRLQAGFLAALVLAALFITTSCSSNKNHAEREHAAELAREAAGETDSEPCVDHCYSDPTPEPVDCEKAEKDLEFLALPIWDFEGGSASNLYTYDDKTTDFLTPSDFQPPTISMQRCIGGDETGVLHIQGGPFTEWGGGMGRHLKCLNALPAGLIGRLKITARDDQLLNRSCSGNEPGACTAERAANNDPVFQSACPERDKQVLEAQDPAVAEEEEFMVGMTLDLSDWDGISFWARRSNNSQPGIRLALGDKYTDDDLNYLQYHINPDDERFCERKEECGCRNLSKPCTFAGTNAIYDNDEYYCLDPDNPEPLDEATPCGTWACNDQFPAFSGHDFSGFDAQFYGKPCTPFALRGGIVESYCYDPETDPTPVEGTDQCGDHWLLPVLLSTEWRLYKVPFTSLHQQGWAKESFSIDLTSAAVVRFTWGTGWIDYYIDDVRVYRDKYRKR